MARGRLRARTWTSRSRAGGADDPAEAVARTALAKHIAETLTKVHALPLSKAKTAGIRPSKVGLDTGIDTGEGAIAWARKIAGDAVDTFLISPLPSAARNAGKSVVCHADLKGEHIFVSEDGTRVTALIDWADMTIADPAVDFAGLVIWLDRRSRAR